jgi:hypothetical protein
MLLSMAQSTCVKCGGTQFEIVTKDIGNATQKLRLIQCASCGGVAGVLEYADINTRLTQLEKALKLRR